MNKKQHLTDLIVLHGFLYNREGIDPSFSKAVAIAAQKLYPKTVLSQAMQKDLNLYLEK